MPAVVMFGGAAWARWWAREAKERGVKAGATGFSLVACGWTHARGTESQKHAQRNARLRIPWCLYLFGVSARRRARLVPSLLRRGEIVAAFVAGNRPLVGVVGPATGKRRSGHAEELVVPQPGVLTARRQQLVVRSLFEHDAAADDEDQVGVTDRRQTVAVRRSKH